MYTLAAKVKQRLTCEAVSPQVDLRKLVCQANMLDALIDTLNAGTTSVSFDTLDNMAYAYASEDGDGGFDSDSDSGSECESEFESECESETELETEESISLAQVHATNFGYITNAFQSMHLHLDGYSENVEEVLSSESEDDEPHATMIEYEMGDDREALSLTRMVSQATKYMARDSYDAEHIDEPLDGDLPCLSNCSSNSSSEESLEDTEERGSTAHTVADPSTLATLAKAAHAFPLLHYSQPCS